MALRGGSGVELCAGVAATQSHDAAAEASTKQGTNDDAGYSLGVEPKNHGSG
jgi:hypothetical protein